MEISPNQLLGEGQYFTIERQSLYDGHTMALYHTGVLNSWNSIEEIRKKIELFTKVIQGPKRIFIDFLED